MESIESRSNPLVRRVRRLRLRKHRDEASEFFVEGIAPVLAALETDSEVRVLVVAPDLLTSEVAKRAVAEFEIGGGQVARLGRAAYAAVSDRENPVGIGAIVHRELVPVSALDATTTSLFVALHDVGNPGNLGTIIRTAGAVGAATILVGTTTDPWHPSCVKAGMGAAFDVTIAQCAGIDALFEWARGKDVTVVTTSARARSVYWDEEYGSPCLFFLGSEGTGLARDVVERGDVQVRIPMEGRVSSLNVAVAAGLLLYEARRRAR